MAKIGPKEAQLRAMRERNEMERRQKAKIQKPASPINCPSCGASYALVGAVHGCHGLVPVQLKEPKALSKRKPRSKPVVKPSVSELQAQADAVPAKKGRGRPKKMTPEERKAYQADYQRRKRKEKQG